MKVRFHYVPARPKRQVRQCSSDSSDRSEAIEKVDISPRKAALFGPDKLALKKATTMTSIAHSQTSLAFSRSRQHRTTATGLLSRLIEKIRFELEVRRSLREIQTFDDKMLRDIGLQRGGIEHALRNGVADPVLTTLQR